MDVLPDGVGEERRAVGRYFSVDFNMRLRRSIVACDTSVNFHL